MASSRTTSIPQCPADAAIDVMTEHLDDAGCLVIRDALDPGSIEAIRSDLADAMATTEVRRDRPADFYPGETRRITALVARSDAVHPLVLDRRIDAICRHHLGENANDHQLHVTAALEIGPGARAQVLHREEDPFSFFPLPRPNMVVATMWAISDFTAENGGTLLVPGSHRWDADRRADDDEVIAAEMPAGSVLVWLGGTLHAAGANVTTDQWRYGIILSYSLSWLRQEENQYLDIPAPRRAELSPELLALTGHSMSGSLGFSDPSVA